MNLFALQHLQQGKGLDILTETCLSKIKIPK